MDYEFRHDIGGQVIAVFSMGHEAIGHWLNDEVKGDLALLARIEQAAADLRGSERQWQLEGHEYSLWLDSEEVMIRANQLSLEGDELDDGMRYYDEESLSLCGLEDFLQVLGRYRAFIQQR